MSYTLHIEAGTEKAHNLLQHLSADPNRLQKIWPETLGLTDAVKAGIDSEDYGWFLQDLESAVITRLGEDQYLLSGTGRSHKPTLARKKGRTSVKTNKNEGKRDGVLEWWSYGATTDTYSKYCWIFQACNLPRTSDSSSRCKRRTTLNALDSPTIMLDKDPVHAATSPKRAARVMRVTPQNTVLAS